MCCALNGSGGGTMQAGDMRGADESLGGSLRCRTRNQMSTAARIQPAWSVQTAKRMGGICRVDETAKNQELMDMGQTPF
jgi:hypothetical protein